MNPVLKYRGGKSREIPHFIDHVPESYDTYFEPFLGGAAVYFYLEPERAVLNDVNEKLITFYRQLRDNYPQMRTELDAIQCIYESNQREFRRAKLLNPEGRVENKNEGYYYAMRELFNNPDGSYLEGVVYYFINKTAYSGMIRYNKKGQYNVPFGRYPNLNTSLITDCHNNLLQGAKLYNTDYRNVFEMANERDFIFLDPPYDCVFNDYGNIGMMGGFDESEHRRLAEDFKNLNCRALMIIGKTDLTSKLYKGYIRDEYFKNYSVNIRNRFNNDKMHLIVKNY